MRISTGERPGKRADLRKLARPQWGVDDRKGKYGRPTTDVPGLVDVHAAGDAGR